MRLPRVWLVQVFLARVTTLSLQPRAWPVQEHHDPDKVLAPAGLLNPVNGLRSSSVPVGPVAPVGLVLPAPVVAPVVPVDKPDPVALLVLDGPELVAADEVPVVAPRVPSVAVAPRVSRESPSGRNGKNLKCGRRQA